MAFKDWPVRRKLTLLVLFATAFALVLACVGLALNERRIWRADTVSELATLADTLGANTAASLAFNDAKTARDILGALQAEHHVLGACLYDNKQHVFAEYRRSDLGDSLRMPACMRRARNSDGMKSRCFTACTWRERRPAPWPSCGT